MIKSIVNQGFIRGKFIFNYQISDLGPSQSCLELYWYLIHQLDNRIKQEVLQCVGWYPCRTTDICQVLLQNVRYIFRVAGQCLVLLFHKHGNDRSLTCTFYQSAGHLSCTLFYGYQPLTTCHFFGTWCTPRVKKSVSLINSGVHKFKWI